MNRTQLRPRIRRWPTLALLAGAFVLAGAVAGAGSAAGEGARSAVRGRQRPNAAARPAAPAAAYGLVASWPDMGAATRVTAAADGRVYVLFERGVRRMQPTGDMEAELAAPGLREVAVDAGGGLYVARAGDVQRWSPAGDTQWARTIRGHTPSPIVGEVPPYFASLAWDATTGEAWLLYDKDETLLHRFTAGGSDRPAFALGFPTHSYWDIDFHGGLAYVLNRTQRTVEVYDIATGVWQTVVQLPAASERIAVGPGPTVFAVAGRRYVYEVAATGEARGQVLHVWDATDAAPGGPPSTVHDVAVDASGRVYVADPSQGRVRVYELDPQRTPDPTPGPETFDCEMVPDKFADPTRLRLGEKTRVTLRLGGRCPQLSEKADIMLVLDHSNSMSKSDASGLQKIVASRAAAKTFVSLMDLKRDQVGLVIFESVPQLLVPLTQDRALIDSRINTIIPEGGTNIAAGIDVALAELASSRRRTDAKPIIVLMTDGVPFDTTRLYTVAAADRARYAGVTAYTVGLGEDADQDLLQVIARSPQHFHYAPTAADLESVYRAIARHIAASVLMKQVTVVDHVPANMQYDDDGTTQPPAAWDGSARTLTWRFSDVPFSGVEMSYWLLPLATGEWPTNVAATYDGVDGLDQPQAGPFPIPHVIVVAPSATPTITQTPRPTATQTPSPTRTPTRVPTPTPTDRPTPSPTPERHTIYVIIVFNQQCIQQYTDVALVIDASTTMKTRTADGKLKLDAAKEAARVFLDQLRFAPDPYDRHDRAAVVWYNDSAGLAEGLTNDRAALDSAIGGIAPVEGSRIDLGIRAARDELMAHTSDRRSIVTPAIVLLSDGLPNRVSIGEVLGEAQQAKRDGITLYAVGFGSDVNEANLRAIASRPELYEYAPTAADLARIYAKIAGRLVCR